MWWGVMPTVRHVRDVNDGEGNLHGLMTQCQATWG